VRRQVVLVSDGMPDLPEQTVAAGAGLKAQGIELLAVDIGSEGINEAFFKRYFSQV